MPVSATSERGCVSVRLTSRIAIRNAAPGAPQAIFRPVAGSLTSANDCVSLPVPAVVGTAIEGSIGARVESRPR